MDAALAEFTERGYHDTTMAAIAERAGVAVQTVYLGFRTKGGLLEDLVGNAVLGRTRDGEIGPPDETEGWIVHCPSLTAAKALALLVDAALPVYERTSAISDVGRVGVRVRSVHRRMVGAKRGAPARRMRADGASPRRTRLRFERD